MYLLHCTWRCNILCSKHANEWKKSTCFVFKLKRKKQVLALVLNEDLGFLPLVREIQRFSTRSATLHAWKKSQIFDRDSCKNLLISVGYCTLLGFPLSGGSGLLYSSGISIVWRFWVTGIVFPASFLTRRLPRLIWRSGGSWAAAASEQLVTAVLMICWAVSSVSIALRLITFFICM